MLTVQEGEREKLAVEGEGVYEAASVRMSISGFPVLTSAFFLSGLRASVSQKQCDYKAGSEFFILCCL